ncbi:NTE family protein [Paucibacter oligotrophus]|uniref:NTE family protein n=1 Tax=Roseateles oligotrophus TaxID=1769250 RepID=A0A840LCT6_9BURK|nr:patatin-like phospholipase family protein [Roseateles oligotrophus]MBB4845976.1 NTE family protein [Roseateles oligotrophus]
MAFEQAGRRPSWLQLCCCALSLAASTALAQGQPDMRPAPAAETGRAKIGLVLSGGGARGLAHVGVLKVLERERIPADVITGTSMGAIIGGLYASGMTAQDLERELLRVVWSNVFAGRVDRQLLSQRRKEEDFEFSAAVELGMRDGEIRLPQGTLSSRGLEILLRRFTMPVRHIQSFDQLPTPFRAIATDMETGAQVVLADGDLALAMRSSMSVPAVFSPTEVHERVLGDGGLVNNLPVDVARRLGAQRLIAVNVGTPLSGRASLSSLVGLTGQMINILTEQNVQRSLATLWNDDVLITPQLQNLSSGDFERTQEFIAAGEAAAEALIPQLRALALNAEDYAAWHLARVQSKLPSPKIQSIEFAGTTLTHPARFQAQLESAPGQQFDTERAERDARFLASSGDYERVDYHVEERPGGAALLFTMDDKYWGPNYFRVGLDLSTDFDGESAFNLRISHNRHWLSAIGTEWRNQVSIGQTPRLFSEIYQPLSFKIGRSNDWFLSAWGEAERRNFTLYNNNSDIAAARLQRQAGTLGFDLGQPWSSLGEVRLGLVHQTWRNVAKLMTVDLVDPRLDSTWHETGLRLRAVVDQLDFANFPQRGYRVLFEAIGGKQSGGPVRSADFQRGELQATLAKSWGAHTLNLHLRGLLARQPEESAQGPYSLGGFQQLSGYQAGQLIGDTLVFGRASYYLRLRDNPVLTRGFFVGGSLELGNAWMRKDKLSATDLRSAASAFIGADTGLGPLYLGLGYAPKGGTLLYLFIGRP